MKSKKVLCSILAAAVIAVSAMPVIAAPAGVNSYEQDVLNAITSGVQVNGQSVNAKADYVSQMTNYLNTVDMTEAQAKEIAGYIDAAKAEVTAGGVADFSKASAATKTNIIANASKAANVMGLTLSVNGSNVKITDANGNVVFSAGNAVKTTGANADATNAMVAVLALAGVVAVAGVAIRKYKLMED